MSLSGCHNKHYCYFLIFVLSCSAFSKLSAQDASPKWTLQGYVKDMPTCYILPGDSLLTGNLIHNRFNFRWYPDSSITFALELRNRLAYGESIRIDPLASKEYDPNNSLLHLTYLALDDKAAKLALSADRLWINYTKKKFELTVGRQRINWGINLVWNPNDLFNTYSFVDFDYEERPGSDAIKAQYFTGDLSSIQVAASPGKKENEAVYAGMYKFNTKGYDIQILGGMYHTDAVIGGGWAGNIKNAGFKGEISYFQPKDHLTDTTGSVSASVSADYTIKGNIYVNVSYLYNSSGPKTSSPGGFNLFMLPVSAKSLMPARHAIFGEISDTFNPIITGGFAAIYAPGVNALFLMPSLSYSITDSWELSLYNQTFWFETNKAFKNQGSAFYLRLKWNF